MFCPECGTELKIEDQNPETVVYEICPICEVRWAYCNGQYATDGEELLAIIQEGRQKEA